MINDMFELNKKIMATDIKDPKIDVLRIEQLVNDIKRGLIKLPRFQRGYTWKIDDILKLLDSIYKGYPIGSVLLWFTKEKLASIRTIGDIDIAEISEEYPTKYVLDGQQRLSTICGVLYYSEKSKNDIWNIVFDIENQKFVQIDKTSEIKRVHFPISNILDTTTYLKRFLEMKENCKNLYPDEQIKEFENRITRLLNSFKDYKLPVIEVEGHKTEDVAPIFERINSSGVRLDFGDLSDIIQKVKNSYSLAIDF